MSRLGRGAWVPHKSPQPPPRLGRRFPTPQRAPATRSSCCCGGGGGRAGAEVEQSAALAVRRPLRSSICRAPPANVTLRCALGRSPSLRARNCRSASARLPTDGRVRFGAIRRRRVSGRDSDKNGSGVWVRGYRGRGWGGGGGLWPGRRRQGGMTLKS